MKFFRRKKNGNIYQWLSEAIDCTNSRNGTPVVIFCSDDNEQNICVCEIVEFYEEFEEIE